MTKCIALIPNVAFISSVPYLKKNHAQIQFDIGNDIGKISSMPNYAENLA